MSASPPASERSPGAGFWIGAVVGIAVMAFGIRGLVGAAHATRPAQVGLTLVGLDVLHDLLLAPLVCLVGWLVVRPAPASLRRPIRFGLLASAMVLVIGWPALRGYGRDTVPDNPTVDPLDYGTALAIVLLLVWLLAAGWAVVSAWRRPRTRASSDATRDAPRGWGRGRGAHSLPARDGA